MNTTYYLFMSQLHLHPPVNICSRKCCDVVKCLGILTSSSCSLTIHRTAFIVQNSASMPDAKLTVQVLAALCTTLGCLLNGAAIAYTGPAIPSLTNITGDPNDGGTVWGGDIRVDAQEASWIGTVMG